jgi:hypothetical protein
LRPASWAGRQERTSRSLDVQYRVRDERLRRRAPMGTIEVRRLAIAA